MTDLKALRMEIARETCAGIGLGESLTVADLESALLQYAEAVLGEPSSEMWRVGQDMRGRDFKINQIWTAMASQRLKEITGGPQPPAAHSPRDWPGDFSHENGRYSCRCVECKELFEGHKRRIFCRECHTRLPEN